MHCEECKICVIGYQLHCSLLGLCVGKHNAIAFYFFIFGLFIWLIVQLSNFSVVFMS